MKKINYWLLFIFVFTLFVSDTYALTIRETMDSNDDYSTIENNSIIIGVTRFSPDTIITASRASKAGSDDAMLYMLQNGDVSEYENPGVYYYVDSNVGWFYLDDDNKATSIDDINKLDIYYVDNVEKVLEIDYSSDNIDLDSLPKGVTFKDNKLFVNATISKFEFMTNDKKKISFEIDHTISNFVETTKPCYEVSDGVITSYNSSCGNDVVIPTEIDGQKITGVGVGAFKGASLVSVVIPSDIKSLGSNAFADNSIKSVIIKDKYDKDDFEFYGDNVFGLFEKITYDNELTRILNYVDDEYVLKYYKDFDINHLKDNQKYEYGMRDYLSFSLIDKFSNNGYSLNYDYCYGDCEYEDRYINGDWYTLKDVYGVGLVYLEDYKYNFILEKYDVSKNKVYTVNKEMNVIFMEDGIKEDYNTVIEAMDNLQNVDNCEDSLSYRDAVTRLKYLEDLEDKYDIDFILTPMGYGGLIEFGYDINNVLEGRQAYYLKNGVLYGHMYDIELRYHENYYIPSIYPKDYENLDLYIDDVLDNFTLATGVNNYELIKNADGSIYGLSDKKYMTGLVYNIELMDLDYSEKWIIEVIDYYDDQYDSNGYTSADCFTFNDGVITAYNGKCGANLRVPDKIDGIDVVEISPDNYYNEYSFGLTSVILPNTLKKIGDYAFNNNRLKEIIIPESVEEIGNDAFSYNGLKKVVIPDSVVLVGGNAFTSNAIEELEIGTVLTKIGGNAFDRNKIKNLVIPSNVKDIRYNAFSSNEIENLVLSEGVELIGSQSFMNNKIKELKLPESLQGIDGGAFTDNQLSDSDAFIYARKYDEENDKYVNDYEYLMSYGGKNRDKVIIPNGVKIIGSNALYNSSINSIELPYGLEKIEYTALSFNNLTKLCIPDTVKDIKNDSLSYNKFSGDNSFIYTCDKDGNIDYSNLVKYLTEQRKTINELVIPDKVKKIWPYAFSYVRVNDLIVSYGVLEIGDYAFDSVYIYNDVTLPKSVEKIGVGVFNKQTLENSDGFVYARNEDGTVDKSIIMGYRAYMGENVDKLIIPEGVVEIRENVFRDIYGSKSIQLPISLKKLGDSAFKNSSITEVFLPKSLIEIGKNAFSQNRFTYVDIPSNIKIIGDNAFSNNYDLAKVTLNEGIEKIGSNAFNGSNRLSGEITIPSSVMEIGDNAFGNNLSKVNILGKRSSNDFDKFGNNPFGNFAEIVYELPKVELPNEPFALAKNIDETSNVNVYHISDIKYTINENDDNTYNINFLFTVVRFPYYDGDCPINYKLYDEKGNIIISGVLDLSNLELGDTFEDYPLYINNLSSDYLRLELFVE